MEDRNQPRQDKIDDAQAHPGPSRPSSAPQESTANDTARHTKENKPCGCRIKRTPPEPRQNKIPYSSSRKQGPKPGEHDLPRSGSDDFPTIQFITIRVRGDLLAIEVVLQ